ncbi:MAG: Fe-S cluster assembly sulfur transfer protein SufU [Bacteroidota bacterium]
MSNDLYHPLILQYSKDESDFAKQDEWSSKIKAYNPTCGDKFQLYLNIENEVIMNASFHGYGCAVSKASTAILIKHIKGKKINQLRSLIADFVRLESEGMFEEFDAFEAAKNFPGRQKCATLAWDALLENLSILK